MAYKAGYGSNRMGYRNTGSPPPPQIGGLYGDRNPNPYGTVNLGGGSPYPGGLEEYNIRPAAPFSGLVGGSRSGYYGSTVGMRRGAVVPPMSSRKTKIPQTEYPRKYTIFLCAIKFFKIRYFPADYASNDLMNSFNGATNSAIPSLRELATYASRYGPAYLRERFGSHDSQLERMLYGGSGPQIPSRGGGIPIDYNMNIASNHWNRGIGSPMGIMSRDVDSYQHDDAAKANKKTTTGSPSTTSTRKPRKARKPTKKTVAAAPSSSSNTSTTAKPAKTVKTSEKSA